MTDRKLGRWLLAAIALVALALAVPAVGAHGDEPVRDNETAADELSADHGATDWATWMGDHVTDHMGQGALTELESHMGVTADERPRHVANDNHTADPGTGAHGPGHGC